MSALQMGFWVRLHVALAVVSGGLEGYVAVGLVHASSRPLMQ